MLTFIKIYQSMGEMSTPCTLMVAIPVCALFRLAIEAWMWPQRMEKAGPGRLVVCDGQAFPDMLFGVTASRCGSFAL